MHIGLKNFEVIVRSASYDILFEERLSWFSLLESILHAHELGVDNYFETVISFLKLRTLTEESIFEIDIESFEVALLIMSLIDHLLLYISSVFFDFYWKYKKTRIDCATHVTIKLGFRRPGRVFALLDALQAELYSQVEVSF